MQKPNMRYGRFLRTKRLSDDRELTLRDVADALGVSVTFVSDVEHGRRLPYDEIKTQKRANTKQDYTDILEQLDAMRETKQELLLEDANNAGIQRQLNEIEGFLETQQTAIEEYDEDLVRKLLMRVMVYDDHLTFEFKSGIKIDITM